MLSSGATHPNKNGRMATIRKKKEELRNARMEVMFNQKREEMKSIRLNSLNVGMANKYAILGDEYHLRQELELGHYIDGRDTATGRTVLLESVAGGHFHLVRMLCNDYKADVNIPSMLGKSSPLHIAVEKSYRQIASLLITFGANINATDHLGRTPLHLVLKLSVMKLLFKFDVDPCIKSLEGLTPLEHYCKYVPENEQLEQILFKMTTAEDIKNIEIARAKLSKEKTSRQRDLDRSALIISSESTINNESVKIKNSPRLKKMYTSDYDDDEDL
eukprot:gene7136-9737_t